MSSTNKSFIMFEKLIPGSSINCNSYGNNEKKMHDSVNALWTIAHFEICFQSVLPQSSMFKKQIIKISMWMSESVTQRLRKGRICPVWGNVLYGDISEYEIKLLWLYSVDVAVMFLFLRQ